MDKVAAAIILQQYLDSQREATARTQNMEEKKMSENENIIELLDENDETVRFEHLATLERDGSYYICLTPVEDDEDNEAEDVDVVFMEIVTEEDGSENYVCVEDEELEEDLFNQFMELLESEGEEDEEADEEQ